MYFKKLALCLVLLNSYFCIGDDQKNTTSSQQDSQNNLGPEFADLYEENEKKFAQGFGKELHLTPEETQNLQEISVCLGRLLAYDVGALARGKSHVPFNPNDTQANQNGQVGSVIGREIGKEIGKAVPGNEAGNTAGDLNSLVTILITRFFGTLGDMGSAFQNNSTQNATKAILEYPDVDNTSN